MNAAPSVPVFVAHGTADTHVAMANADLFVVEAMRQQKERPLRYLVVDGAGHGFEARDNDVQSEVLSDFTNWAASGANGRSFATIATPPGPTDRYVTRYFGIRDRAWFVVLPIAGVVAIAAFAATKRLRARRREGAHGPLTSTRSSS